VTPSSLLYIYIYTDVSEEHTPFRIICLPAFRKSNVLTPSLGYDSPVIAHAVIRLHLTTATRVRSQVRSCGICGGQSGTGASFLRVLWFPLPILILPTAPHSSFIIRGWYNRPNSGRRTKWTQSHPTPINQTKKTWYTMIRKDMLLPSCWQKMGAVYTVAKR
jgi:hypothetical protein